MIFFSCMLLEIRVKMSWTIFHELFLEHSFSCCCKLHDFFTCKDSNLSLERDKKDNWEGVVSGLLLVALAYLSTTVSWGGKPWEATHQVVPDKPVRYVAQSRTWSFFSPCRLPYSAVRDLIPPPVVMMATTGVWATQGQKGLASESDLQLGWEWRDNKRESISSKGRKKKSHMSKRRLSARMAVTK